MKKIKNSKEEKSLAVLFHKNSTICHYPVYPSNPRFTEWIARMNRAMTKLKINDRT